MRGAKPQARLLLALTASALLGLAGAYCEAKGSGHGLCRRSDSTCECFDGFNGGDCSLKLCPTGRAWVDFATGDDEAHAPDVPCSNMGVCDEDAGKCECREGFGGMACERLLCPDGCSNNGRCVSMRQRALMKDPGDGDGAVHEYDGVWDADMIFGCVCDEGYTGYNCAQRACPRGDDPMTKPSSSDPTSQRDEVQVFLCTMNTGSVTFTFQGATTAPLDVGSDALAVRNALESLPTIEEVVVSFALEESMCLDSAPNYIAITFMQHFGDVPHMHSYGMRTTEDCAEVTGALPAGHDLCGHGMEGLIHVSGHSATLVQEAGLYWAYNGDTIERTDASSSAASVLGTKENAYCSSRGWCDLTTGMCECYDDFMSSDGRGDRGTRGDCGSYSTNAITGCPGPSGTACSFKGMCQEDGSYTCSCDTGWAGGACAERSCPTGQSWFDLPLAEDRAHQSTECSNNGICDISFGECICREGWEGAACDMIKCPGETAPKVFCSGHGRCLTMADMALEAVDAQGDPTPRSYGDTPKNPHTWDARMVRGCVCMEGYEGFDCKTPSCPTGDDPLTNQWTTGVNEGHELQHFVCLANGGSFKIKFRGEETGPIEWDATPGELKAALEELSTIRGVEVHYHAIEELAAWHLEEGTPQAGGGKACVPWGQIVSVTFTRDHGDLPALQFVTGGTLTVAPYVNGGAPLDAQSGAHIQTGEGYIQGADAGLSISTQHGSSHARFPMYGVFDAASSPRVFDFALQNPTFGGTGVACTTSLSTEAMDGSTVSTKLVTCDLVSGWGVATIERNAYTGKFKTSVMSNSVETALLWDPEEMKLYKAGDASGDGLVYSDSLPDTIEVVSVDGNMENALCSNRGHCKDGQCVCFSGFGSSDGSGNPGDRGDCGWQLDGTQ